MLSEWPTEAEAAALLGASVKTITRYAEKGLIEVRKRPRLGKKPENVCNPADVEKLLPQAHVMPAAPEIALATPRPNGVAQDILALIRTITTAIRTEQETVQIPASEKLWLNLEEAQAYSGLARRDLLGLCREGKITARKSGGWKIRRASLEAFEG